MSNEKVCMKNNKRKKKMENDQVILESLAETHIFFIKKASNKFPKAKFVCKLCPYHMDDIERAIKHSNDIMHNRNLKKLSTKNLLTYLPRPSQIQYASIEECLQKILNDSHFISVEETERRIDLCQEINKLAHEINPANQLVIYGSILTGLSLKSVSDVNLFFDMQTQDSRKTEYLSQMKEMQKLFKSKLNLKTKINLDKNNSGLFCKDKFHVSYHIAPGCRMKMFSSELIKIYLKIDRRAENLAKLFRYLANISFIDQVKDGMFPSDVFAIMVIFYLQQLSVPILPNLHKIAAVNATNLPESVFCRVCVNDTVSSYVNDINWIRKLWIPPVNNMSLSELWIGMLKFYLVEFNYQSFMVSISSAVPVLKIDRNIVNKRLSVEDPFDTKKNLLFNWNSPDVIDFVNDQLQGCYIYFAVPQLDTGPLFTKVSFQEISLANIKSIGIVKTPIFNKDSIGEAVLSLEIQLKVLYNEQKECFDITKWPMELFVKLCLEKILPMIFTSFNDIKDLIVLLELKIRNCFQILRVDNYSKFKEYATRLAKCVLEEFVDTLDKFSSALTDNQIETSLGLELVKKSAQRFVNESLNITTSDDSEDMEELEECDLNGIDESVMEKEELTLDEVEEIDSNEAILDEQCDGVEGHVQIGIQNPESWKLPIMFKSIYFPIKGVAISSENPNEYNEDSVKNLKLDSLVYNLSKMVIHNQKLVINCTLCNTKGHRKENCQYAVPRFDELQDILKTVDPTWLLKLRTILKERSKEIVQTDDRAKQTDRIFDKISEIVRGLYPTARPQMFGSTISGFKTRASDMDICLEFYDNGVAQNLSAKEVTLRLKLIGREIKKLPIIHRVDFILRAKVPIIKFYTRFNVHGDISINNILGIQNTKMLRLYVEIGNGVKQLGNLIKYMTKACEIGDASMGTLSSYAYMLMLIHFLQKRGVLPVLQELYEGERPTLMINGWDAWYQTELSVIYKLWNKKPTCQDIEYLWLDFFYYYAVEFDFDKEVVTIKQSDPLYKIDKNWQSSYMAVEDPFNLSHNLCGSLCLDNCRYILECFSHVLRLHSDPENLNRPDNVHYLLLEPKSLQPPPNNNRTCYICNRVGHLAKDCVDQTPTKKTPVKITGNLSALPPLGAPLQLKLSNIPNRYYLQSDIGDDTSASCHIPLKTFKGDMCVYSVVPLSVKFEDQTVIVPMIVAQNELIERKLDNILKNGSKNVVPFPSNFPERKRLGSTNAPHGVMLNVFDDFSHQSTTMAPATGITNRRSPHRQSPAPIYNRTNVPEQMINRNVMLNHPQRLMNHRYRFDVIQNSINNSPFYQNIPPGFNPNFHGQPENIRSYQFNHQHHQNWNYPEMEFRNRSPMNNNNSHMVQRGGNRK